MSTALFSSNDVAAVGARHLMAHAHDDGVSDLALLDLRPRERLLDRDDDDVAQFRRSAAAIRRAP
jgi:hypothetical protein